MINPDIYKDIFHFFSPYKEKYKITSGIILGSGLGDFAEQLEEVEVFYSNDIPGYPTSTVSGHAGKISICQLADKFFLVFSGRVHLYEGYAIESVLLNAVLTKFFDAKFLIVTNAAGGINAAFKSGDLMLIDDLFFIHNKLRFVKLSEKDVTFIDKEFNNIIFNYAYSNGINLVRGVYGYSTGPCYETPAEVQFLKFAGCDAVGMSTIPEIVFSLQNKIKIIGISCISNLAAGISKTKLSHEEVKETANLVKDKFAKLLKLITLKL